MVVDDDDVQPSDPGISIPRATTPTSMSTMGGTNGPLEVLSLMLVPVGIFTLPRDRRLHLLLRSLHLLLIVRDDNDFFFFFYLY